MYDIPTLPKELMIQILTHRAFVYQNRISYQTILLLSSEWHFIFQTPYLQLQWLLNHHSDTSTYLQFCLKRGWVGCLKLMIENSKYRSLIDRYLKDAFIFGICQVSSSGRSRTPVREQQPWEVLEDLIDAYGTNHISTSAVLTDTCEKKRKSVKKEKKENLHLKEMLEVLLTAGIDSNCMQHFALRRISSIPNQFPILSLLIKHFEWDQASFDNGFLIAVQNACQVESFDYIELLLDSLFEYLKSQNETLTEKWLQKVGVTCLKIATTSTCPKPEWIDYLLYQPQEHSYFQIMREEIKKYLLSDYISEIRIINDRQWELQKSLLLHPVIRISKSAYPNLVQKVIQFCIPEKDTQPSQSFLMILVNAARHATMDERLETIKILMIHEWVLCAVLLTAVKYNKMFILTFLFETYSDILFPQKEDQTAHPAAATTTTSSQISRTSNLDWNRSGLGIHPVLIGAFHQTAMPDMLDYLMEKTGLGWRQIRQLYHEWPGEAMSDLFLDFGGVVMQRDRLAVERIGR